MKKRVHREREDRSRGFGEVTPTVQLFARERKAAKLEFTLRRLCALRVSALKFSSSDATQLPKVTLGLVQMRCSAEPARKSREGPRESARRPRTAARRSSACRSSSPRSTSARSRTTNTSQLAEEIPGPSTEALGEAGARTRRRDHRVAFRKAERRASTTTPRRSSTPTARISASIGRCTSRTTRCFTRSSTSRPAISASARGRRSTRKIGVCVCWDQWYPEAARLTALRGAQILFYPTAIGWHPGGKGGVRRAAARLVGDDPALARDRQWLLRRGAQSRRTRGAGWRRRASSFGGRVSSPIRPGRSWRRRRRARKKS